MCQIIPFETRYRDDMIFCLLLAKDALGRTPVLNEDLLDIQGHYFNRGGMFWVAVDRGRVVGLLGGEAATPTDMWLKRFYVKPGWKRQGVGTRLLAALECFASSKGVTILHTRFPHDFVEAARFYLANGFVEVEPSDGLRHCVKKIPTTGSVP